MDFEGCEKCVVGAGGFEPSTYWSQTNRATKLRYAPFLLFCRRFSPCRRVSGEFR